MSCRHLAGNSVIASSAGVDNQQQLSNSIWSECTWWVPNVQQL